MTKKKCCILLLLALSFSAISQERDLGSEFIVWSQITQKIRFNETFSGSLAGQYRAFTDRDEDYHLFFAATVTRKLAHGFSISAGFMNLNINRFVDADYVLVPELRPVQSIQFAYPINKSKFSWRFMTEQRFFKKAANGELVDGFIHNWRFRNKFGFTKYVSPRINMTLSSEVMVNAGDIVINIFDQHRAQGMISYKVGNWNIETGYMHWFFQTAANSHENRHTWVVGLVHSL